MWRKIRQWLRNVFVAFDQLGNSLSGGDPDETLSSRWGKSTGKGAKMVCSILDKIDKDHCAKSIEADEGKDALK